MIETGAEVMQGETGKLKGKRILIVEDEFLVAELLLQSLEQCGAEVVGPAATLHQGMTMAANEEKLDCAVLDINLRGNSSYPIADILRRRGIPFLFATGYDSRVIPERYGHIRRCEKPVSSSALIGALQEL
jgi:CheY-like chemotaxis protein